jgi:hypothetical protein
MQPYASLNLGDIHQYYDSTDNIYFQYKVIDTTRRVDGKKVFDVEEFYLLSVDLFRDTSHQFIKDNFLWTTQLDTTSDSTKNEKNKFNEEKLAEVYPKDGDYFVSNKGLPDSQYIFIKIDFIDSVRTYCGTFMNIARYHSTGYNNLVDI